MHNGSYGNGVETTPVMRLKQNVPRRLIYTALIPAIDTQHRSWALLVYVRKGLKKVTMVGI
jgi:hypothetical protein